MPCILNDALSSPAAQSCLRQESVATSPTHPPSAIDTVPLMFPNLCLFVCSVSAPARTNSLPLLFDPYPITCVPLLKVTHSLTSLPTHTTAATLNHVLIAHVISHRCSPASLADSAGDVFYRGWTAGCTKPKYRIVFASLWCCSRRRSEHGATPPCCGVPVP